MIQFITCRASTGGLIGSKSERSTYQPSPTASPHPGQLASLKALVAIREEEIWLAKQKGACTRRAYRLDVARFMRTLGITSREQLRQA